MNNLRANMNCQRINRPSLHGQNTSRPETWIKTQIHTNCLMTEVMKLSLSWKNTKGNERNKTSH